MRTRPSRRHARTLVTIVAATLALAGLSTAAGAARADAASGRDPGVAITAAPGGNGYAVVSASGGLHTYGGSQATGGPTPTTPPAAIVGSAAVPGTDSLWLAASDGEVFPEGGQAASYGSLSGQSLKRPISAILASATGQGYLLVARDGTTSAFGDYPSVGSLAVPPTASIVAAVRTPDARGVWLVSSTGGVFGLGTARSLGSTAGRALAAPISAAIASPTGKGYLLIARDGSTFAFGDYPSPGSLVGQRLDQPIVAAAAYDGLTGVWLLGADGGVFSLTAPFYGSASGEADVAVPSLGQAMIGDGGREAVRCPAGGSIVVAAQLAPRLSRLLAAGTVAGYAICGSGYRSAAQQIALRTNNCGTDLAAIYDAPPSSCSPPTARPGTSQHELGLAVDFTTTTAGYAWLTSHSSTYGLYLLVGGAERWHFSTTGH